MNTHNYTINEMLQTHYRNNIDIPLWLKMWYEKNPGKSFRDYRIEPAGSGDGPIMMDFRDWIIAAEEILGIIE